MTIVLSNRRYTCVLIVLALVLCIGCSKQNENQVVIYTSLDQIFSEPILNEFETKTGIQVKTVYDVEASKTTGLVNRLIAEKKRPKCDVFWNSEVARTIVLMKKDVLEPYVSPSSIDIPTQFKDKTGYWTGFAARARILIYNTNLINENQLPNSILAFAEPKWKNKVALSYPLFGTTATHMAALYAVLGQEKTEKYLTALKANDIIIVDGNSVTRDLVVEGQVPIAFTDTDDANVAIQSGKPVNILYPDKDGMGTLFIPNTVALIKNAPHAERGKKLIDYLLSKEVESMLAFCKSAQIPLRDGVNKPKGMPEYTDIKAMIVDYEAIAQNLEKMTRFCQTVFIR